jgi:hypothetical protein
VTCTCPSSGRMQLAPALAGALVDGPLWQEREQFGDFVTGSPGNGAVKRNPEIGSKRPPTRGLRSGW